MPDELKQIAPKVNPLQVAWQWLEGRKTTIGAVGAIIVSWLQATKKIDDATAMALTALVTTMTGVGIVDKIRRGTL
jgi:membrane protein YdbS with pleckstrin-like domain